MSSLKLYKLLFILSILIVSCVPQRKFQEVSDKNTKCQEERALLKEQLRVLEEKNKEVVSKSEAFDRNFKMLQSDTALLGNSLRILRGQYDKINLLNDELLKKTASLKAGSEAENGKLLGELMNTKEDLQKKQDVLNKLEAELASKSKTLEEREKKVNDLESLLTRQEEAAKALKDKVANALLGFKDKGLTVEQKNGKVYVNLEAKLLFASGSTKVDQEGKQAIIDLAKALEGQKDLQIIVEGHTDVDKINSSSIPKDNWELSVLRATSVVKIMTENSKVEPIILTAAGRGEFIPVDANDKAKNRRIEVIISPKLDDLFKIIEN
jgi:chemotaxis protein MotB